MCRLKSFYTKVLPVVLTLAIIISAVVSTIVLITLLIIKGIPINYVAAIATGILAIATIAYVFVAVLLRKSYNSQTKVLEQHSINQKEQNEIMKAQTTALQLQVKNLELQNNLLRKELKLLAMEKRSFLTKFNQEQIDRYDNLKQTADVDAIPLLEEIKQRSCEDIRKKIKEIDELEKELGE